MVITGRTRNALALRGSRVRIPPSPLTRSRGSGSFCISMSGNWETILYGNFACNSYNLISKYGIIFCARDCKYSVHCAQCASRCLWNVVRNSRTNFCIWGLCFFRRSTAQRGCPTGGDMPVALSGEHSARDARTSKKQQSIVKCKNLSDGISATEQSAQ